MRAWQFVKILTRVCLASFLLSQSLNGQNNSCLEPLRLDISANVREDSLSWNIAGVNGTPNVASELEWRGVRSLGVGVLLKKVFFSRYPLELKGSYNKIFAGKNCDLDFFGENRTDLFLKSRSKASDGELFDISAELGVDIPCIRNTTLVPYIGYSLNEQHLKIFDGFTEFNLLDPDDIGPIKGLNSGYNARWFGPYIGIKGYVPMFSGTLGLGLDYYFPRYEAEGHANLRTDIIGDYFHRSRGFGREFFAEFQSALQEKLLVEIKVKFGKFWTKRGRETETLQTEMGPVPIKVNLNRVEWKSKSISAHIIKKF